MTITSRPGIRLVMRGVRWLKLLTVTARLNTCVSLNALAGRSLIDGTTLDQTWESE